MKWPKLSVIIPTRARCEVLQKTLRTVTSQDYDNLDVVISDNFSCDSTEEIAKGTGDPRVRYLNTGRRISMSHNWEFALSHVLGGWVTIIGDDDGLLPGALKKVAAIIEGTNVRAIRSRVCEYSWPSLTGETFGRLVIPLSRGHEFRKSRVWLDRVLAGICSYVELPMLYNGGFVCSSVLKEMRKKAGVIYRSRIPDVYSAIAISSSIETYFYSYEPLAINGASCHSTGTAQFGSARLAGASPAKIFALEDNLPFHGDFPLTAEGDIPPSIQALIYESLFQFNNLAVSREKDAHSTQLRVILTMTERHTRKMNEWAREFARVHNLNFRSIAAKARLKRMLRKVGSISRRVLKAIDSYRVGSSEVPIRDVYDASMVAGEILADDPGRLRNIQRLIRQTITFQHPSRG